MADTFIPHRQRRAVGGLERLADGIVRSGRSAARIREEREEDVRTLADLKEKHPHLAQTDIRESVGHGKFLAAIGAAVVLDAILAGPVGEYILTTFIGVSAKLASVAKFGLPLALIAAEMGIARLRVADDASDVQRRLATCLAVGLLIVMPILVGETAMMAEQERSLFAGPLTALVAVMMGLTLCVHALVLFTGEAQEEALTHVIYRARAKKLARDITRGAASARSQGNAAADQFATWAQQRDLFSQRYPNAPVPQPHWGQDVITEINTAAGYEAIRRQNPTQQQSPPTSEPPNARPAERQAQPAAGAADVREAEERRRRESDAEVVGD